MSTDPTPAATPEAATLVDDLIEIWTAPSKVFARRATSGFFVMMCIVTLLIGGFWLANQGTMQGIMDAEYARQMQEVMKQNPSLTPEQLAGSRKVTEFFTSYGVFVGIPIGLLLIGFGTWITGKVLGAEELGYGASTMIAAYSYLPKALESLLYTVQGVLIDTDALTGRYQLSFGVGRFLDPTMDMGVLGLLGRIDLFTIWVSVLLGIGITVVGKLPRSKVAMAAIMMWVLGAVPSFWTLLMGVLRGGD